MNHFSDHICIYNIYVYIFISGNQQYWEKLHNIFDTKLV